MQTKSMSACGGSEDFKCIFLSTVRPAVNSLHWDVLSCATGGYAVQVLNAQEEAHAMHFKKMREQFAPCRLPNNPHRLVKTTSTC